MTSTRKSFGIFILLLVLFTTGCLYLVTTSLVENSENSKNSKNGNFGIFSDLNANDPDSKPTMENSEKSIILEEEISWDLEMLGPAWENAAMATGMHLLSALDEVCQRKGFDYFLTGSTLWGAVQLRGFVQWVKYLEVAIDEGVNWGTLSDNLLTKKVLLEVDIDKREGKIYHRSFKSFPILKLKLFRKNGDKMLVGPAIISQQDVFPLKRLSFYGYMLKVPHNERVLLDKYYGEKWETNCALSTKPDKPEVSCSEVADKYGYTFVKDLNPIRQIPKIIHQVWLGKVKKPPHEIMETCKNLHPDWEYHLWTDENLPDILSDEAFEYMAYPNGKADILRWELLKVYGGVWIDADSWCLRPIDELLLEQNELFAGHHHWSNPNVNLRKEKNGNILACSVVGAVPNHPVINAMVEKLQLVPDLVLRDKPWRTVGPIYFTGFFSQNFNITSNYMGAYPFYYFVPYHWSEFTKNGTLPISFNKNKPNEYGSYGWNSWGSTFKLRPGGVKIDGSIEENHGNEGKIDSSDDNNDGSDTTTGPKVFFAILSHEKYEDRRNALRTTWLSTIGAHPGFKYAFFLGNPSNGYKAALEAEQSKYNDIAFVDVEDSFATLNKKVVEICSYVSINENFDVLFKTDDDTFIDLNKFAKFVGSGPHEKYYMGYMWDKQPKNMNPKSQWYDPYVWDDPFWAQVDYYPRYASGSGYGLSADLVQYIHQNKHLLRQFHNEDAMVGIWMTMLNVEKINCPGFIPLWKQKKAQEECASDFMLAHNVPPSDMKSLFDKYQKTGKYC